MVKSDSYRVSVIIPALNEEKNIKAAVDSASSHVGCEVIVVDGGSDDGTCGIAKRAGAKVVLSPRGRARQLNSGAAEAGGGILLFLHADSCLPERWGEDVQKALQQPAKRVPNPRWGCFETIQIDADPVTSWVLRHAVALRTRLLHRPYGDQALFVQRACFQQLGGFADLPLLEDVELVARLKRHGGRPAIVPKAVQTSGRRWKRLGLLQTTLINQAILAGHALGVDVQTLAALYERTGHQRRGCAA